MRYTQETIILGRNVTWGEMLQGKMLHWEKCYIGENVTGENVTGEFVTGENVLGENVIHPQETYKAARYYPNTAVVTWLNDSLSFCPMIKNKSLSRCQS